MVASWELTFKPIDISIRIPILGTYTAYFFKFSATKGSLAIILYISDLILLKDFLRWNLGDVGNDLDKLKTSVLHFYYFLYS